MIIAYVSFIPYFCLLVFGIAHLALQNVNKNYIIYSYFHNFFAKSDQKPKMKNGMNETKENETYNNKKLFTSNYMYP